jgi:hypothetical protein
VPSNAGIPTRRQSPLSASPWTQVIPILKLPAGTTIISGQSTKARQRLQHSFGLGLKHGWIENPGSVGSRGPVLLAREDVVFL